MRYIYATPGAEHRVMHIARHDALGEMLWEPLCGWSVPRFNRSINAPFGLGRPVCRNCKREAIRPKGKR